MRAGEFYRKRSKKEKNTYYKQLLSIIAEKINILRQSAIPIKIKKSEDFQKSSLFLFLLNKLKFSYYYFNQYAVAYFLFVNLLQYALSNDA